MKKIKRIEPTIGNWVLYEDEEGNQCKVPVAFTFIPISGPKCPRCRKKGQPGIEVNFDNLCNRCLDAVKEWEQRTGNKILDEK